jgi:hypothetical protein
MAVSCTVICIPASDPLERTLTDIDVRLVLRLVETALTRLDEGGCFVKKPSARRAVTRCSRERQETANSCVRPARILTLRT